MNLPPRLPPDEEQQLITSMLAGDRSARDKLIEHGMVHAYVAAKRYRNSGIEWEDRFSLACMGLVYAVDHFDPAKGNTLKTNIFWAAAKYLNNEIRHRELKPLSFPANLLSLDEPLTSKDGTGDARTRYDFIMSGTPDTLESVERSMQISSVHQIIEALPDRLRLVMQMRYLDDPPVPQKIVAERLGCSPMTVSRRERDALKAIREQLSE